MTTLLRWGPIHVSRRELSGLPGGFDPLFDSLLPGARARAGESRFAPAADIHENAEAFLIRLDLPGVAQQDVKVTILGDTLTIRGERRLESRTEHDNIHYRERPFGAFERSFNLTAPVRPELVKAAYRDGVLEVRVPKAEEARTREIEVQVG